MNALEEFTGFLERYSFTPLLVIDGTVVYQRTFCAGFAIRLAVNTKENTWVMGPEFSIDDLLAPSGFSKEDWVDWMDGVDIGKYMFRADGFHTDEFVFCYEKSLELLKYVEKH